jgi:hypothetical protein
VSAGQSPGLLIITSAAPSTAVGLAASSDAGPRESPGTGGGAAADGGQGPGPRELFQQDEPGFPDSEEQEGRCPSPLPVSIDDFGQPHDLQDMMPEDLPWNSEHSPPPQELPCAAKGMPQREPEAGAPQEPSSAAPGVNVLEAGEGAQGPATSVEGVDGQSLEKS